MSNTELLIAVSIVIILTTLALLRLFGKRLEIT